MFTKSLFLALLRLFSSFACIFKPAIKPDKTDSAEVNPVPYSPFSGVCAKNPILGLQDSSELTGKITRNGSTHRCVMAATEDDPFMTSHSFKKQDNLITFVETELRMKMDCVYTLQRIGKKLTRVQRHDYIPKKYFGVLKYKLFKKKPMLQWIEASWENFKAYCARLEEEGEQHPAQILFEPAQV